MSRGFFVGAASAALLVGGGIGATATAHAPAASAAHETTLAASNNLQVKPSKIAVHKNVAYTGSTPGLSTGTEVQLQQLIGKKWFDVNGKTAKTRADGTYGPIYDSFMYKGEKVMRTIAGGVPSNSVNILVS
ncbi:hypothetical protein B1H18_33830 [Streptomyces tsukubensis]|uniref:Uncharacterized protein n=1 Tax=Streptomyces tsukubensis TaxID=83656 RepID=A0A1V3ZYG0_9ACTN|nr:hypothetical protein B1H18_33830 [Streptomyces tsukubensis]